MADAALPDPLSDQLRSIVAGERQRAVYGLLYRRRGNPPTEQELRFFVENVAGEDLSTLNDVLGPLDAYFDIRRGQGPSLTFQLVGWAPTASSASRQGSVSLRMRAEVLASQRCAQCGRSPEQDGARLTAVQKIPINWGGEPHRDNLEPLCEDCNVGRQQYFAKWDHIADKIRGAVGMEDPRQRIGELLRALSPDWVRADLIEAVACAQEYQDDWQRRLRDLRFLGWDYEHRNRKLDVGDRTWSFYRLTQSAPWPENIPTAIKLEAQRRKLAASDRD